MKKRKTKTMNSLINEKQRFFNAKKHYIFIKDDVYGIVKRIREIDDGYFIVLNTLRKKYEIHNINNKNGTYCFTSPYDNLDSRTYDYTQRTRIENSDKLLKEIEIKNEKIKKDKQRQFNNEIKARAFDTRSLFMKEE